MAKRMKVDFGANPPIFRISIPGVNVDTATSTQLMLDESILSSQVVATGLAIRSNVGNEETVNVAIPNLGFIPIVQSWARTTDNEIVYPSSYRGATGLVTFWYTLTNTQISFRFGSTTTINAIYWQVLRVLWG